MSQNQFKILGVRFDKTTLEEASGKAIFWAKGTKKRQICTPNPEMVLEAQKNEKFLQILNQSDLNIIDGIGIIWAARLLKLGKATRITGVDLMQKICQKASNEELKIFLFGGGKGVAEKVKNILELKYPKIKITGTYEGSPSKNEEKEIIEKINQAEANILFIAFGAPKQEIWIARNLKKLKTVKLAMGVGGSFDFIAGVKKRAPKWLQKIGLEWLYRLIQEPGRIKRIYNATIKFPLKVLKGKRKKSSI